MTDKSRGLAPCIPSIRMISNSFYNDIKQLLYKSYRTSVPQICDLLPQNALKVVSLYAEIYPVKHKKEDKRISTIYLNRPKQGAIVTSHYHFNGSQLAKMKKSNNNNNNNNNNGAYIAQFQKMIIALYKIQNIYKEQEHA